MSKQRTAPNLLIGLAGGPGAGKDTTAGLLVEHYDFHQHAFADALRDFVFATNDAWRLAFDMHGYEVAKREVEGFRDTLINVGESARNLILPDIWIEAVAYRAYRSIELGHSVVISDVRYENEARFIREAGGLVVAVERPEYEPETDEAWRVFRNADDYLYNYGPVSELWEQVDNLIESLSDV